MKISKVKKTIFSLFLKAAALFFIVFFFLLASLTINKVKLKIDHIKIGEFTKVIMAAIVILP